MFLEILGVHLPGMSFPNPGTPLREAFTRAAGRRATEITALGPDYRPLGEMIDERSLVNAIVGLHATGGSTNHTLHLIAIARAAGIQIDWTDFDELSAAVPLLTRIYPNGVADVNHFRDAGGMPFLIDQLLGLGLLHPDVGTVAPAGSGQSGPGVSSPTARKPSWAKTARSPIGRSRRAATKPSCGRAAGPSRRTAACAWWPATSAAGSPKFRR